MASRPFLGLVALGPIDPDLLRRLRTAIAKILALPARILRPLPLPPQTLHVVRHQYHSTQILEYLLASEHASAFRLLGVTAGDLYIPILTFVFGEAQLDGQAAIVSLFRPRGDADGSNPPKSLLLKRLIKLSLHELGHTFGLGHCRQDGCLMGFAPNLEKLDQKNLTLCNYCQILLADYYRDHGLLRPIKPYAGTPVRAAAIPTSDSARKRRQ